MKDRVRDWGLYDYSAYVKLDPIILPWGRITIYKGRKALKSLR